MAKSKKTAKYLVKPTTIDELKQYCNNYKGNLGVIDTSDITSFKNLFSSLSAWTNDDFNGINDWDTRNVTDMSGVFQNCQNFNQNLDRWDVRKVTNFGSMFRGCRNFNQPLNNWSLDSALKIDHMFQNCSEFNSPIFTLPVNNNITITESMFYGAKKFNQPLTNWVLPKVERIAHMFRDCYEFNQEVNGLIPNPTIQSLDSVFSNARSFNKSVNDWNISNVTFAYNTFNNAYEYNQPMNSWDFSKITDARYMFQNCYKFNQDISGWNTEQLEDARYMFNNCYEFNQPLKKWNVSRLLYLDCMFYECRSWFQSLDNWNLIDGGVNLWKSGTFYNTKKNVKAVWFDNNYYPDTVDDLASDVIVCKRNLSRVKTMMITDMSNLFSLRVPGGKNWTNDDFNGIDTWDVELVTNVTNMLKDCRNFNQNISGWRTLSLETINSFAENCTSFNQNLDSWHYQNIIDRSASTKAFANCPTNPVWYGIYTPKTKDELVGLVSDKSITLDKIDTKFITDMSSIFQGSDRTDTEFNGIDTWDTSKVTTLDYMFDGAVNFNKNISNWNVNNVTSAEGTFRNCTNYNQSLNTWNTSNFTNTSLMLKGCSSYNQPMDAWNSSKLKNISEMFDGCISLSQDFDMWDARLISDMTNAFNDVVQRPWWYELDFEKDVVINVPTDYDFTTLYPLTSGKQLTITSNSTDLTITRNYGNSFQFSSNVLGSYVPLVEYNGGKRNIKVRVVNPDVSRTEDVKARYFKVLDFVQLYSSINITSLVISNESTGLTVEKVQNYEYRFKADGEGTYTANISVNNIYNGVLTFNSTKLIPDFTITTKTDETTRKDFNTEYQGYDVTSMTVTSNDTNLVVTKESDGIFTFRPLTNGTFTATIDLLGINSTVTVNSTKILVDISETGTATIREEIDIRNLITNIDYTKLDITSSNPNFIVTKKSEIIYELLALVSGSFTAEISYENETSTLTYDSDKLLSDETRKLSSNKIYSFNFNQLFPNSVLKDISITSQNPDLVINETSKNVFTLEAQTVGTLIAVISINGEESNLTLIISKYINDETFMVYNRFFNINFATKYPGLNTSELKVTPSIPNANLKITKVNDDKYTFTFYKKGTYSVDVKLGKVISTYIFKVFFVDSSNIDIYQYPETFISDFIKPQLYDPNLYIYQYNQYGEIEWVNKLFKYINDKISKTINYIYLWYVVKTNQDLSKLDMSFIDDNNIYYYLNFLERNFDSIYKSFGNPGAIIFWDTPPSQWNDGTTKWDETVKTSDMSINKFKSILRFIKDISNKSFNINRFQRFCYEFINCDRLENDPINNIYLDETSFVNPEDVIIFVDIIDENTNLLTTVLRSAYKRIMPMYNFIIRQKIVP